MFQQIEIFSLGLATVIDTALLLAMSDRDNVRHTTTSLWLLVGGAWLYHAGATLQALLSHALSPWAVPLYWGAGLLMAAGLLLMPSSLLHGVWRIHQAGFQLTVTANRRIALLYLPLLLLVVIGWQYAAKLQLPLFIALPQWALPYMLWLSSANLLGAIILWRKRNQLAAPWARSFASSMAIFLVLLTGYHNLALFVIPAFWPAGEAYFRLGSSLSPVFGCLLFAYYVIRHRFMHLILEQALLYGTLVVGMAWFHQVILAELWQSLSHRYQINFAFIEGIAIIGVVLAYRPLRLRTAEALRYWMGRDSRQLRKQSHQLAITMSALSAQPLNELITCFVRQSQALLHVQGVGFWLFEPKNQTAITAGTGMALSVSEAAHCQQQLVTQQRLVCRYSEAPNQAIEASFAKAQALLGIVLQQETVAALVLFGSTTQHHEMSEEEINIASILVEHIGITIHNNVLQAQRLAQQRRIHQNDKLSSIGLIASSIAHEVKNPLSSIKTIATVMSEELAADSPHHQDLKLIIGEVNRLANTVTGLLRFARPPPAGGQNTSLAETIATTLGVMRHVAGKAMVTIELALADDLPKLRASEDVLREILFNLLANAIEAASPRGQVQLRAHWQEQYIHLSIYDSGPGISAAMQAQLFQPFVSSKAEGTGLGLYMVHQHVVALGGEIKCRSPANEKQQNGTIIQLRLPGVTP